MAAQPEPEIILYDLANTKDVCFSPVVWRIRLMLNYKQIPYQTVFLEFPDIEPTLKQLGIKPREGATESQPKYTVPTIHHLPTNSYITESATIADFLESTYPEPPVPLTSELGEQIEKRARAALAPAFAASVTPREVRILSPRAQEHFRRPREAKLGCRLEELLVPSEKEEEKWRVAADELVVVDGLLQTNQQQEPFILGSRPSYSDFAVVGALQSARVIDEGCFQRVVRYPGFMTLYEACASYLERNN